MWLAWWTVAHALTLTLVDAESPYPGVELEQYRTASPATDVWVVRVDLCADGVEVVATGETTSLASAGAFGSDVGAQLAVNADFYRVGPVRVYGDVWSDGVQWPLDQTGLDPAYSSEWYYGDYGWLAFGHDEATFTHTGWVKDNAATFGIAEGWQPTVDMPDAPPGVLQLVSGFPELVIEGQPITCPSPTDPSCFPDRSDMRDRHPRTAMGLTEDRATLIIAVADGRTGTASGMYGAELADLMGQLGAWVAFNYDGGGSSQLWLDDRGYWNNASGNNSGGGVRSVANHLGIRASGAGRPAHCPTETPCELIPPPGGTIDDASACFGLFGPDVWWREESVGHDGHLYWTNSWNSTRPLNWAWWRLELEEAGEYRVEYWAEPGFAVYDDARFAVVAGGVSEELRLDLGAATGWLELGTWTFDAGGGQFVAVYDDDADGSVVSDQHIAADAVRLTRIGPWCGDGACDADESFADCPDDCPEPEDPGPDPGPDTDDPTRDTAGSSPRTAVGDGGCGCGTGAPSAGWVLLPLLVLAGRRARSSDRR